MQRDTHAEQVCSAGPFLKEGSDGWQKTLQVDLWAVIVGTQLAALAMRRTNTKGASYLCAASSCSTGKLVRLQIVCAAALILHVTWRAACCGASQRHGSSGPTFS